MTSTTYDERIKVLVIGIVGELPKDHLDDFKWQTATVKSREFACVCFKEEGHIIAGAVSVCLQGFVDLRSKSLLGLLEAQEIWCRVL